MTMSNTETCSCGNPINGKELIDVKRKYARFLCECWSGDINQPTKKKHYFIMRVKLSKQKNINSENGVRI